MRRSEAYKVKQKRLLLIDDEEEFSSDLVFLLDGPYQIVCASGSNEAIELLEKEKTDLVILDLHMPSFYAEEDAWEGVELLRLIRKKWGGSGRGGIPVIILSKMVSEEARRECEKLEADALLAKPPEIEELKEKIGELLK